jgi:hypothetical protein
MTDNAFAAALFLASFPAGVAGGVVGVWIARWAVILLLQP